MTCVLVHPLGPAPPDDVPPTDDMIEIDELRLRCVLAPQIPEHDFADRPGE